MRAAPGRVGPQKTYLAGAVLLFEPFFDFVVVFVFVDVFPLLPLPVLVLAVELVVVVFDCVDPPLVCATAKPAHSTTIHTSVVTFFTDSPFQVTTNCYCSAIPWPNF